MVFLNVLLPILVLVAVGYGMARGGRLSSGGLSKLTFWILSPALIFVALYENEVRPDVFLDLGVFIVLISLAFWGIALAVSRLGGLSAETGAALALALVFTNSGNYGLPFLLFAFGDEGFQLGVVYVSISSLLMSTLGIVISTWGDHWSWAPFGNILKTPLFYSVILAVALKLGGVGLPLPLMRPLELLAQAAIPMMLLLLGTQLVGVQLGKRLDLIGTATLLRLGLAPLAAWGLAGAMGFSGLLHDVAIVESSMPTAVNALVLASYYGRDSRLVSSVVLATTALSAPSLTALLLLLRGPG
jgi:hypothetical protein